MMFAPLPATASLSPSACAKPHWAWLTLVLFSSNLLSLALPLLTLQIYDRILVYAYPGTLNILCLGTIVALAVEGVLRMQKAYVIGWSAAGFEHVTTCNFVRHAVSLGAGVGQGRGMGDYYQHILGIGKIRDVYTGRMMVTVVDFPFVLMFLAIIYYLGGALVWVPVGVIVFMALSSWIFGGELARQLSRRNKADSRRYAFLMQCLGNIHVVKSIGREAFFERLYERDQYASSRENYRVACANANMFDLGLFIARMIMVSVIGFGVPLVLSGSVSMGGLVACVILTGRIVHPVQRTLNFWAQLQDAKLASDGLREYFSIPSVYSEKAGGAEPEGTLELKGVSCADSLGRAIVNELDFSLNKGAAVLLSGDNADDVQTLLALMVGLRKPDRGSVLVDHENPMHFSSTELTRHVGYLEPSGVVFRGSVGDNLSRFGSVEPERVREMARLLRLDDDIDRMPMGYETFLEGGKTDILSPGFQQRIAIARVLAEKPKIIVFNNADRALDKSGYNCVYSLLARLKGHATLVIVSRDPNLAKLADRHFVLSNGRLDERTKEVGTAFYDLRPYKEIG